MLNKKSQVAVILAIAVFIMIIFIMKISYDFIEDMKETARKPTTKLDEDLQRISFAFETYGYPTEWHDKVAHPSDNDIGRIGFLDKEDSYSLDLRKLNRFADIPYTDIKNKFSISKDYLFYFTHDDKIESVNGKCSFGTDIDLVKNPQADMSFYYHKSGNLLQVKINAFPDYVFTESEILGEFGSVLDGSSLNTYKYIILEDSKIPNGAPWDNDIQNFIKNGYNITMGGEILNSPGLLLGVEIYDKSGNEEDATRVSTDNLLSYLPDTIKFVSHSSGDYYTITPIDTDPDIHDFKPLYKFSTGEIAAATWKYGEGVVYYFSTFNIEIDGESDQGFETVKYLIYHFSDTECDDFTADEIDSPSNLFTTSRIIKLPGYEGFSTYNLKVLAWE